MRKLYVLALMCAMLGLSTIAKAQTVTGTNDGHDYVDLGLPSGTLWATCNIGASQPEEYGDYFAWGETEGYYSGKTTFDWSNYKWCNGDENTLTKYCTDSSSGNVDNKTELDLEDDAAYVNWGPNWRIPSISQIKELCKESYVTRKETIQNGIKGILITSISNGNSIFMPAAGYRDSDGNVYTWFGDYWSRTLKVNDSKFPYSLYFSGVRVDWDTNYRETGQSVRPVVNTDATSIHSTSTSTTPQYYTLDGKQVSNTSHKGVYVVKKNGRTYKVIK